MSKRTDKSIIYVNFSPYENSGKILDYLLDTFKYVFLFSFDFHKLRGNDQYNKLTVYRNGKGVNRFKLYQIPVPQRLLFLFLPIRSILIFIQLFIYTVYLYVKYSQIDYYFTVNAFTAWCGQIIKRVGLVKNTVFWVWDYYPPHHKDRVISFMRKVYWQFDKISSNADRLVFLNQRLKDLRTRIGILTRNKSSIIVPIGTEVKLLNKKRLIKKRLVLCFIGVVKKSQGLDLVFRNIPRLLKRYPNIKIEIIGSGPDEQYFKELVKDISAEINFYGYIGEKQNKKINNIMANSSIGIATYIPEKSNVTYYGDPSKIKQYLSYGLPVITTNVFNFSDEIKNEKAGIVINYEKSRDFVEAVDKIVANYSNYNKNAIKLAKKYNYKRLYSKIFQYER